MAIPRPLVLHDRRRTFELGLLLYIWEMVEGGWRTARRDGAWTAVRCLRIQGHHGKIVEIDAIADSDRVRRAAATVLTEG
jgi:hypothetical protein